MARYYRKRYRRRYRRYKKRSPVSTLAKKTTVSDVANIASMAWNGVKAVMRMINVESKFYDIHHNSDIDTTGTITNLAPVPTGDGQNARDGVSIKPQHLTYRFQYNVNQSAYATNFRLVFLRGKNENDTDLAVTDIFNTALTDVALTSKIHDKRFKTKILFDRCYSCDPASHVSGIIEGTIKLFGHVTYDNAQSDGTDLQDGGIYMILLSNEATNKPNIRGWTRVTYCDN